MTNYEVFIDSCFVLQNQTTLLKDEHTRISYQATDLAWIVGLLDCNSTEQKGYGDSFKIFQQFNTGAYQFMIY